jgi:hypothetical protein
MVDVKPSIEFTILHIPGPRAERAIFSGMHWLISARRWEPCDIATEKIWVREIHSKNSVDRGLKGYNFISYFMISIKQR